MTELSSRQSREYSKELAGCAHQGKPCALPSSLSSLIWIDGTFFRLRILNHLNWWHLFWDRTLLLHCKAPVESLWSRLMAPFWYSGAPVSDSLSKGFSWFWLIWNRSVSWCMCREEGTQRYWCGGWIRAASVTVCVTACVTVSSSLWVCHSLCHCVYFTVSVSQFVSLCLLHCECVTAVMWGRGRSVTQCAHRPGGRICLAVSGGSVVTRSVWLWSKNQ